MFECIKLSEHTFDESNIASILPSVSIQFKYTRQRKRLLKQVKVTRTFKKNFYVYEIIGLWNCQEKYFA